MMKIALGILAGLAVACGLGVFVGKATAGPPTPRRKH